MKARLVLPAVLLIAACSPSEKEVTEVQPVRIVTGESRKGAEGAALSLAQLEVTPSVVRPGQTVTVRATIAGTTAGTLATLAWFGPDGWLVAEDTRQVSGGSVTFAMNSDEFEVPGRYVAEVRVGEAHLGSDSVDVSI